jgi:KDO2-lipid IV(A) lauroyltransferase
VWVSAHLPLRVSQALGALVGALAWRFSPRTRSVTLRNLELCLPELTGTERKELARSSLMEAGKTFLEVGALWRWPRERITGLAVEVSGRELVDQAVASGRGVILASPHLGAWEMVGLYWSTQHLITSLYRPSRVPTVDACIRRWREHLDARLVPADAGGVKALLLALKRGQIAGILPDQEPGQEGGGAFVPFFGVPAWTMTLLSRLASRSGALVVFCYAERLPKGKGFHLQVIPAPEAIADEDPVRGATALNQGVEDCVRRLPQQYQWAYRRFRTHPPGEASRY